MSPLAILSVLTEPKAPRIVGKAKFPHCHCGSRQYRAIKDPVAFTRDGYRFVRQHHQCLKCGTKHNFQRRLDKDWDHNIPAPRTYSRSGHRVRM